MAVTEVTTNDIIDGAYRILGVRSRDRALTKDDVSTGLYYLNQLLDHYSSDTNLIAYDGVIDFPVLAGQREYTISDQLPADVTNRRLAYLKYVNLVRQQYRYPVEVGDDTTYWNFSRDTTLTRRPRWVFLQNEIGLSNLIFLEIPDQDYTCFVKGKFVLEHVELSTILTQVPIAYHRFLEYALANELKARKRGASWTENAERNFQDAKLNLTSTNDIDITVKPDSLFVFRGKYQTPNLDVI